LSCAKVAYDEIETRFDLPIGIFGKAYGAGLGDALQSRGNIDAVTHQVAVALLNHIAEMDANAKLDATLGWDARVALNHAVLHLDGAAHSVNDAAEFNDGSVASALDNSPIVDGNYRVDQIAPQRSQSRQYPIFVGASKPAVSDHVRYQYSRQFAGFGHGRKPPYGRKIAQPNRLQLTEFSES
jgi:hypothetical protein